MKKLAIFAALLFLTAAPARAEDDLDAIYRAQMEADLKKLDFPCAEDFGKAATEELVKVLKQYWDDLRNDREVPDDAIACRLRSLVKRDHIDHDLLTLYAYAFYKDRPDYAVYFFTVLERGRPHAETRMLASAYAYESALQDIPRAISLFRADVSSLLSSTDPPEECAASILSFRHSDGFPHPLYNVQLEWAAALCSKSSEYLSRLAENLDASENVDDRITAQKINLYVTGKRLFRPHDTPGSDR